MKADTKQWIEEHIEYIEQNDYDYVLAQIPYVLYKDTVDLLNQVNWFDPLILKTREKSKEVIDYIHHYAATNDMKFHINQYLLEDNLARSKNAVCQVIILPSKDSNAWKKYPVTFVHDVNAHRIEVYSNDSCRTIYPELIDILDIVLRPEAWDYKKTIDEYMKENQKIIDQLVEG